MRTHAQRRLEDEPAPGMLPDGSLNVVQSATVPQSAVDYVDTSPTDDHCARCTMYLPASPRVLGACTAVAGDINRRGWCRLFEPLG